MHRPHRTSTGPGALVRFRDLTAGRHHRPDAESGQATLEFALILIPLLLLVVGIIQFGIALNYWLDMNRLSNQGARWAVVNAYPGCTETDNSGCGTSLQSYLACQRLPAALNPNVDISFPNGEGTVGNSVQVKITSPYTFRAIMKLGTITLSARTTMRIERDASRYAAGASTCP